MFTFTPALVFAGLLSFAPPQPTPPESSPPAGETAPESPPPESPPPESAPAPESPPPPEVTAPPEQASEPAAPAPAPTPAPSRFVPPGDAEKLAEAPIDPAKAKWIPGKGIEVATANKRYSLQFGTMAQLQVPIIHVPAQPAMGSTPASEDTTTVALVFRRARLSFGGNLFTPNIKYKIQLTASPVELGFKDGLPHRTPILDWYFTFDRLRDLTFQVGQYKVAYNHQRMLRVTGMQFVDRSAANNEFTMDRDIGFDFRSKDVGGLGHLRYYVGMFLGDGIAKYGPSNAGFMYTGRVEILPFGQYDDLEEGDHERSLEPRMLIGGAYAFIDRDPNNNHSFFGAIPADGGSTSTHNATADLNFRIAGFSLESAFFWRKGWRQAGNAVDVNGDPIPVVAARNGMGYFVQAGYLIPKLPLELGARWGQIIAMGDTSLRDQQEVGGVINYVFLRHLLKLQLDYLRLWNDDIALGTDQVRLQLQVTF